MLRLSDNGFVSGLKELTNRIHEKSDTIIAPQLIHFLKISRSGYRQRVEDLSQDEIREIPQLFSDAAHEKVTCIQWKKKDGTMNPPCP